MIERETLPPERDLPDLGARRNDLVTEARASLRGRTPGWHSLRPRYALAATLVLALAVFATPAFGGKGYLFGLIKGNPALPGLQADQTQQLVTIHTTSGQDATLWEGPTDKGGKCVFLQLHASGDAAPAANGGSLCDLGPASAQKAPIQAFVNWIANGDGTYTVLVDGHLASQGASASLQSATGSQTLDANHGYFLVELSAAAPGNVPAGGPYVLSEVNPAGKEIGRVDLQQLIAQSQP
jgi:hypothetical protein